MNLEASSCCAVIEEAGRTEAIEISLEVIFCYCQTSILNVQSVRSKLLLTYNDIRVRAIGLQVACSIGPLRQSHPQNCTLARKH
jgi:hypothetical protein